MKALDSIHSAQCFDDLKAISLRLCLLLNTVGLVMAAHPASPMPESPVARRLFRDLSTFRAFHLLSIPARLTFSQIPEDQVIRQLFRY